MAFDAHETTIDSVHEALYSGKNTVREVVLSFLARIQALNPKINAVLALNSNALSRADELDDMLLRGQVKDLQLFGIPVLLKDNFNTHDMPTTGGSLALAKLQPTTDAPTVAALRKAGAIILGKANMHEMALEGLSVSLLGGQTLNPYDLSRTPGGSSGGSGAAVAASLAVFATGTDTMNSLRSPASANSLFSCRPTSGLVSTQGVIPISHTQDAIGPIGRCVKDVAIALEVMAGTAREHPAERSPVKPPLELEADYVAKLTHGTLKGLRLGVIETFLDHTNSEETAPVVEAMTKTVSTLRDAGAVVVSVKEARYNSLAILKSLDTQRFEFREDLDAYLQDRELVGEHPKSFQALYSSGEFLVIPSQYEHIKAAHVASTRDAEYLKVQSGIQDLITALCSTFDQHNLDALIYPQQARLAVKVGSRSQSQRNGILAAVTGSPVVTVPIGYSSPTTDAPLGVPIGMEILGRHWTEAKLLQIAYQFEQLTQVRKAPQLACVPIEVDSLMKVPPLVPDRSISAAYPIGTLDEAE